MPVRARFRKHLLKWFACSAFYTRPTTRVVGRGLDKAGILGRDLDTVGIAGRILDTREIFGRHFAILSTLSVRMSPEKACNV